MGIGYSHNILSDDGLWESVAYYNKNNGNWDKLRPIFIKDENQFSDEDMINIIIILEAKKHIRDLNRDNEYPSGWKIDKDIIKLIEVIWNITTKQYDYKCNVKDHDTGIISEVSYSGDRMHRLAINKDAFEDYKLNGINGQIYKTFLKK